MLSEGDKAECKEIARAIVKEVLIEHIQSCPHGKTILVSKWVIVTFAVVGPLAGSGLGALVIKLLI